MMLLALFQPGPPPAPASAEAACSRNMPPRLRPRIPEPPTRSRSRRLIRSPRSHTSLPGVPGMTIIGSLLFRFQIGWSTAFRRPRRAEARLQPDLRILGSMVKQERRAVDQGPRQVLRADEALL